MPSKKASTKRKQQSHNALFNETFLNERYCLDIFRLVFTSQEFKLFNWKTLKPEMTVFTDEQGNERRMDLLFSVQVKGSRKRVRIFFLLEHKSHQDSEVLQQILRYQTLIYNRWNYPVIPILVYHGRQKHWKGALNFQDSLDGLTPILRQRFGKNILNFHCKLLNIHDINFYRGVGRSLLSRPILLIMGSIWRLRHETVVELFQMGTGLGGRDQEFLVQKAVDYIRRNDPHFTLNVLRKIEKESIEEEQRIMSALQCSLDEAEEKGMRKGLQKGREEGREKGHEEGREKGHEEGREKGREEGREKGREEGRLEGAQQTALRMVQNGFEVETICLCTGLTSQEVEELRKKVKATKS